MRIIYLFVLSFFIYIPICNAQIFRIADTVARANRHFSFYPVFSEIYKDLDINTSYKIQKAYIDNELLNRNIAGFKAGLTSKKSQTIFSVDEPVSGILFESGKLLSPSIINLSDFRKLYIETELGYLIKVNIEKPIKSEFQVNSIIDFVMPVIELPDLGFNEIKSIKATDIIITNFGSLKYIVGNKKLLNEININEINTSLYSNGKLISKGTSIEVMDSQVNAIKWLINNLINYGYNIKAGSLIITGVIGNTNIGNKGIYMANFDTLGKIHFEIR